MMGCFWDWFTTPLFSSAMFLAISLVGGFVRGFVRAWYG